MGGEWALKSRINPSRYSALSYLSLSFFISEMCCLHYIWKQGIAKSSTENKYKYPRYCNLWVFQCILSFLCLKTLWGYY